MAQKQGSIGETSRYDNTFKDKPAMDFAGVNSGVKDSIIEEPVEKLSPLPMRVTADPPRNIGGTSHRSIGGVVSLIDDTNVKSEQQERRKPSIILDNSDAFKSVSTKSISRGELKGFGSRGAEGDDNGATRSKQRTEKSDIFSKYKKEPREKRVKRVTEIPAHLTVVNEFGEEIPPEPKAEPVKKISAGSTQKSAVINGGVVTENKNATEKDRSKLFIILNLICTNGIALLCVMFLLKSQATKDQLTQVKMDLANATATVQELSNQINGVGDGEIVVDDGSGNGMGTDDGGAGVGTGSDGEVASEAPDKVQPPILPTVTWKSLDVKQDTIGLTKEMWNGVSVYTPDKHISGTFLADNSYEMQGKDVKEVLRFVSGSETPKDLVARIEAKFKTDNPELKVESVLAEHEEKRSFTQIKYTKDGAIYEHYMVALRVSSDVMLEIEMISSDKTDVEVREAFTKSLIINVIPRFEEVTT